MICNRKKTTETTDNNKIQPEYPNKQIENHLKYKLIEFASHR